MEEKIYFKETQSFRQLWLWVILIAGSLFSLYIVFKYLPQQIAPEEQTSVLVSMAVSVFFSIGFLLLFLALKLKTEVRGDGVYYCMVPFQRKFRVVSFTDFSTCKAVEYKPIREYGGWGIRCGRNGRAFNVSGNRGVRFELNTGKTFLLGSQKAEEFCDAIKRAKNKR